MTEQEYSQLGIGSKVWWGELPKSRRLYVLTKKNGRGSWVGYPTDIPEEQWQPDNERPMAKSAIGRWHLLGHKWSGRRKRKPKNAPTPAPYGSIYEGLSEIELRIVTEFKSENKRLWETIQTQVAQLAALQADVEALQLKIEGEPATTTPADLKPVSGFAQNGQSYV